MSCPMRTYPIRKPEGHKVPVPRWSLNLPEHVTHVNTTYIGVQRQKDSDDAVQVSQLAIDAVQMWVKEQDAMVSESFVGIALTNGEVQDVAVWACYWSDITQAKAALKDLSLSLIYTKLPSSGQNLVGLWQESFTTEVSRLETNYSGLDYLPGLAKLPGAGTAEHTLSAYWGAARDRIPDSAHDLFPTTADIQHPEPAPHGTGQDLIGTNHDNMVHIRSGQFWENCGQQESDSYEQKLEPTLRSGLTYLYESPEDTKAFGIRYLRNEDVSAPNAGRDQKESCGAGFFANLEDLERWAHKHPSHLKIYGGALSHYKVFGDGRKFRTWHEVSVIKEGDARFEYVNCVAGTGAMGTLRLKMQGGLSE